MKRPESNTKDKRCQDSDGRFSLINYTITLEKYCDHTEAQLINHKELCMAMERKDNEIEILKEALKVYKSGRYPSLSLLDKIEEILKP